MKLMKVDPRALNENPDPTRRTKSSPQSDALLLATIKAVGIIQPPIVTAQRGRGNGFTIEIGHRRVTQAIAAKLDEIEILVADPDEEKDALRSLIENVAREALNPVDLWRRIERLVALGWNEESIGTALGQSVRQIRKLRLLANILPAMLDHIAKGDMPSEQHLRTIVAATQDEQAQVWKKHKPRKTDPQVSWSDVARALTKDRMYARHANFGDDLAQAYGIVWQEDLFAPADEDSRYTNDVEAFLGAQQEWMTANMPKRSTVIEVTTWGDPKLPPKAERVYGKPNKSDCTGWYLDPRNGSVQSIAYRMQKPKKDKAKAKGSHASGSDSTAPASRPDVTRRGMDMIGDLRTDALHEAFARAPIEDDTLTALLVLAFAGGNVSVASGRNSDHGIRAQQARRLIGDDGSLAYDRETLQQVAREVLTDVLSCRENRSNSGVVARVAGSAIGADEFLPNLATEEFLSCLSRGALEASLKGTPVLPRQRVKDTRAALVAHYADGRFVYPAALFAPTAEIVAEWAEDNAFVDEDDDAADDIDAGDDEHGGYAEAAE
ncbi:putative ParB-like nuclease (plasmid) [Afipia carboxidovorans OM5]|uniref:Putative ParB-like nuclease n=1 Tax=Afipia carboxidovorans (strain ATCC 49405 / DSM 1227 / KCTC 32145 / OM5) TaxID=504832 RepID=F8C155_AFIC5|nr:ParB/RepB/Spo0J family partition protein [Afipia carboxidovorans]AEI04537.1 putative ParB-like nuclease [Afipia carboxidovorans OM4]AEI08165.1 putative ParB-like nuclease [Afipia carboxidovorans OM5]